MAGNMSIGGLVGELMLRDKDFTSKLNRAGKLTNTRTRQMRDGLNKVGRAMGMIGAVAGGIMVAGISRGMKSLDEMAKRADKLRVAPEVLAGMKHWANLSGVEIGQLDSAMARLNKTIGDAMVGRGEGQQVFERLKLNAEDLMNMAPEKAIDRIAEALRGVENANERAYLAQELFGRGAGDVISGLVNSGMSFEEAAKEAERYGLAVSRIDLAQVEMANDEITRLKAIHEGLWQQITVKAAPAIMELANRILTASDSMGGMGAVAERVLGGIVKGAGFVADVFAGWQLIYSGLEMGWLALERTGIGVMQGMVTGIEAMVNKAIDSINILIDGVNSIPGVNLGKLAGFELTGTNEFLSQMESQSKEAFQEAQGRFNSIRDRGRPSSRMGEMFDDVSGKWEEHAKSIAESREALQGMEGSAVEADEETEKMAKAAADAADELMSLSDIASKGTGWQAKLAQRAQDLNSKADAQEASGRFSSAERTRGQAQEIQDRLDLRRKGYSADEVRSGEAAEAEAEAEKARNMEAPAAGSTSANVQTETTKGGGGSAETYLAGIHAMMQQLVGRIGIA